jgi:NTP pyrophosphatase (non-canonical NTP hydrolase)
MCSCFNSKEELEEGIDNILAMWNYLNKQYSKDDIKKAFEYNMQKAQNRYKVIGKLIISEVE